MKKFNMQGALYKSDKNPEEIKKEICKNKPAEEESKPIEMIEVDNSSELPKELAPLQSLVDKISPDRTVTLPAETWKTLAKWAVKARKGASREAPMLCTSEQCPYAKQCPLIKSGVNIEPFTECPLESYLMEEWDEDMAASIADKPGDKLYAPDLRTISHSTLLEILMRRTTMELANDPEVVKEVVIGIDEEGKPVKAEKLNDKITAVQNMIKTEEKLHDSLLATRKSRAAAGDKLSGDSEDYIEGAASFAETEVADEQPDKKRDEHSEADGNTEGSAGS